MHRLDSMFAPRGIAIVGASDRSGWSTTTFANLRNAGYSHEIHLVNQKGGEVHGQPAVTSLEVLQGRVELAYVLTGPDSLPSVMQQAAQAGIANLVVIAAGFGEMGEDGLRRERELARRADDLGLRILGPNNLGFINTVASTAPWSQAMPWPLHQGSVGVLSQSGALGIFLLNYLQSRDVSISHLITVGNEAQLTVAEGMDYLLAQDATKVIALYLESIRHADVFLDAAQRALAAGKPVVVYKAGRGEVGAKITAAHTGALAGDDKAFSAVFRQHGVIRVDTIEDMVTTAGLLAEYGEMPGGRVAFVTASGAMCGVIGDTAEASGLVLPELAPETVTGLKEAGLPDFATPQNPLDTTGYVVVEPDLLPRSEQVVSRDPGIDILVVNGSIPTSEAAVAASAKKVAGRAELVRTSPVPVVQMELFPTEHNEFAREWRRRTSTPHVVDSFTRGIPALAKAIWWSELRRTGTDAPARAASPIDPGAPTDVPWTERQARQLLAAHGVPVVPQELVTSADGAASAADGMPGPWALKISSPDILHKSDVGGVALGLTEPAAVREAYEQMIRSAADAFPEARIEGALLSPMVEEGFDLIVGVVRDEVWGPMLVTGLGGVWVEVLGDSAIRALPVSRADVRAMFDELKAAPLLRGARGTEPADLDAVTDVVMRIAELALGLGDDLAELEVNPLRVRGADVQVLDALMRWRGTDSDDPRDC